MQNQQPVEEPTSQQLKIDFQMKYVQGYRSDFKNNIFAFTQQD